MKIGFLCTIFFVFRIASFAQDDSKLESRVHDELLIVSSNAKKRVVISEGEKLIIKTDIKGMRRVSGYFRSATDSALMIGVANLQPGMVMEVPFKNIDELGVKGKKSAAESILGVIVIVSGVSLVIGGTTLLLDSDSSTGQPAVGIASVATILMGGLLINGGATLLSPRFYKIGGKYKLQVVSYTDHRIK